MFSFLVSLINHEDEQHGDDELAGAGLSLAATAIEVGGDAFATHPQLLALLRQDLAKALTQVAESRSPAVLSAACGLMVTLYIRFRPLLRVQLELWLSYVLLPLAEGGSGFEQQRAALEAVGDLCRQPCFVTDLFANYDCDLRAPNLFGRTAALLCKSAFPVSGPLSQTHVVALEALLAEARDTALLAKRAEEAGREAWEQSCSRQAQLDAEELAARCAAERAEAQLSRLALVAGCEEDGKSPSKLLYLRVDEPAQSPLS